EGREALRGLDLHGGAAAERQGGEERQRCEGACLHGVHGPQCRLSRESRPMRGNQSMGSVTSRGKGGGGSTLATTATLGLAWSVTVPTEKVARERRNRILPSICSISAVMRSSSCPTLSISGMVPALARNSCKRFWVARRLARRTSRSLYC